MARAFSFLIHAGDDKARIAPTVRALIEADIPLWIDDPRHPDLGLGDDLIAKLAGRVIEGADWPRQRNQALQTATSFLIVVSEASIADTRAQVQMEAAVAEFREERDGCPIFPLPLSQAELERGASLIGRRQGFKTYVEQGDDDQRGAWRLTERGARDVGELIAELRKAHRTAAGPRTITLEMPSPYLADRHAQAIDMADALRGAGTAPEPRLVLPVMLGTRDDRPDKFALHQLPDRLVPRLLRVDGCETVSLPWPHYARHDPRRAARFLRDEIDDQGAAQGALIVYAQPRSEDLRSPVAISACLELWCATWHDWAAMDRRRALLPVLDLRTDLMGRPALAKLSALFRRRGSIASRLQAQAGPLSERYPSVMPLVLPPLGRITWSCIEEWLRDEVGAALGEARAADYRARLDRSVPHAGLEMERWARHVRQMTGPPATGPHDGRVSTGAPDMRG
ncbi:toll/interleukin-1 receptor domain-containing protein [Sphingomonas colocasiae]|uniref:Toll/interleukin-1 receptor domain-containing protein n=1 Tax=Sphingomonas colocasiae TaxID=1848973 RepID=A0ABS7PPL1_9SPHN|nr:toll/interleukin-1 receptor domain-containing protein [Sphingomonas colocasiae]MBY8823257.1 toll/interleukin-1 receptor domain-containing protein [Sphingomonas colocasiae]